MSIHIFHLFSVFSVKINKKVYTNTFNLKGPEFIYRRYRVLWFYGIILQYTNRKAYPQSNVFIILHEYFQLSVR